VFSFDKCWSCIWKNTLARAAGRAWSESNCACRRLLYNHSARVLSLHLFPELMLMDKTRIHLRSASVRIYTFFTTGIQVLINPRSKGIASA
jgi:hypothetical protein